MRQTLCHGKRLTVCSRGGGPGQALEVFRRIDKRGGSGRVDARELGVALKMLGQRFSREQARDKRQAKAFCTETQSD